MKSAIEEIEAVSLKMLAHIWQDDDIRRLHDMLHGCWVLMPLDTNLDVLDEIIFLRDLCDFRGKE